MTTILFIALLVVCNAAGTVIGLKIAEPLTRLLKRLTERPVQPSEAPPPYHPQCRSVLFSGFTPVPPIKFKLRPQREVQKALGFRPWSKKYACCRKCKTTEFAHHENGKCLKCYRKGYIRPSRRKS